MTPLIKKGVLGLIKERHSTRSSFDPHRLVSRKHLLQIIEAARWSPTAHNMQNFEIIAVDDPKVLRRLGKIKSRISEEFLRENYEQLSFSKEELLRKRVGVLASVFPPSWRDPAKLREVARKSPPTPLSQTIQGSPMILIVLYNSRKRAPASEGDYLGILSLGCIMENMWLEAESLGIGFQVMSVFTSKVVEKEVRRILDVPEHMKIAYAIRLGYPLHATREYVRVRRDAERFTHYNRY